MRELLVRPARVTEVDDDRLHVLEVLGRRRRAPALPTLRLFPLLLLVALEERLLRRASLLGHVRVSVGLRNLLGLLLGLLLLVLGEFLTDAVRVGVAVEVNRGELRSHRRLTRNLSGSPSHLDPRLNRLALPVHVHVPRGLGLDLDLDLDLGLGLGQRLPQQHVLGLEIGVDDLLAAVEVVQTHQDVPADGLHRAQRDTAVIVPLDEREEVIAEHLEAHAHVRAVRSLVLERVHQPDHLARTRVRRRRMTVSIRGTTIRRFTRSRAPPRLRRPLAVLALARLPLATVRGRTFAVVHLVHRGDLVEDGDLVPRRLGVVRGALLHLERHLCARGDVVAYPHGGEVAPPQLLPDDVPAVLVGIAHGDGVVPALPVPLRALVLGLVLGRVRFAAGVGPVAVVAAAVAAALASRVRLGALREGRAPGVASPRRGFGRGLAALASLAGLGGDVRGGRDGRRLLHASSRSSV